MNPTTVVVNGSIGSPKSQPITLPAGNSLTIKIPIVSADGSALDLTGAKGEWQLAPGAFLGPNVIPLAGASNLIKKGTDVGGATLSQVAGIWTLTVQVSPADTESIGLGVLFYEADVIDAASNVATIAFGRFTLLPTVLGGSMVAPAAPAAPVAGDVSVYTRSEVDAQIAAVSAKLIPIVITQVGQTVIPLPLPPPTSAALIVDGREFRAPFITLSSTQLVWAGPFPLEPSDDVFVRFN